MLRNDSDMATARAPSVLARRHAARQLLLGVPFLLGLVVLFGLAASKAPVKILVLGDSLTAGYGLRANESFPAKLEVALRKEGLSAKVINAGVSGDTTQGGKSRLTWALADEPDVVVVELGANDMLRGLDPVQAKKNLDAIVTELRKRKISVILAGMRATPNLGPKYVETFDGLYPELAKKHDAELYPFFLEGVAMKPKLNQADGLHPNAQGVDEIVRRFLPVMKKVLADRDKR